MGVTGVISDKAKAKKDKKRKRAEESAGTLNLFQSAIEMLYSELTANLFTIDSHCLSNRD